jgi:hypothetical protein
MTRHFSKLIANWFTPTACCTSLVSITLRLGWRQRKPPWTRHFAFAQTRAKRTLRELKIFITAISTMMVRSPNWTLHTRACPMIREYLQ